MMRERPSARLLVLDNDNCVLLFHFVFDAGALAGEHFWATPGGALNEGESYAQAAKRELFEETGIVADVGEQIAKMDVVFRTQSGERVTADERYFLVRVAENIIDVSGQESAERRDIQEYKWWSLADLKATHETVFPEHLADLLTSLLDGDG